MIRLPAEWEQQAAVCLAWPDIAGDFKDLPAVERSYTFIADTISRYQPLIILCKNAEHQQHISGKLQNLVSTHFIQLDYDDIWLRDTLFLTVEIDGAAKLLNFRFNGWGHKYPHQSDDAINRCLLSTPIFKGNAAAHIDIVLEGGSLESDGLGTLLTTTNCLLNRNRNPELGQSAINEQLKFHFGAKRILWLEQQPLAGDDTDAHIDTLARFCDPDTIAYSSCQNSNDPHYPGLQRLEKQLQSLTTAAGKPYRLVPLPLPQPVYEGDRPLPANYANFLIINEAVLVPVYGDNMDQLAINRLTSCFPGRTVIATPCRPIVEQYGSLHCMTMQFPATVKLNLC